MLAVVVARFQQTLRPLNKYGGAMRRTTTACLAVLFIFAVIGCRSPADRLAWKTALSSWQNHIEPEYAKGLECQYGDDAETKATLSRHAAAFEELLREGASDD